ncbi:hypothetical protein O9929_26290 [Vibrio lentus]|nr:hypothetical protein [Vibrio lentus]
MVLGYLIGEISHHWWLHHIALGSVLGCLVSGLLACGLSPKNANSRLGSINTAAANFIQAVWLTVFVAVIWYQCRCSCANSHQTKWRNAAITWRVVEADSQDPNVPIQLLRGVENQKQLKPSGFVMVILWSQTLHSHRY